MGPGKLAAVILVGGTLLAGGISTLHVRRLHAAGLPGKVELKRAPRTQLTGHIHPLTRAGQDVGAVEPSLNLSLALVFKPSITQQAALDQLLEDQQDRHSPLFHRWITPEEYADAYGLSSEIVEETIDWLGSRGITVREVAPSRNQISFEATAAQAEGLFDVQLRRYRLNGEVHYANSADPFVPEPLANLLAGVRGLNDFRIKPRFTSSFTGDHLLAPDDFTTIYDVKALYASGIDGTGEKLAVAGQSDIQLSDIQAFRKASGLAQNDPQVILDGSDPGTIPVDLVEADLDLEWAGSIAKNATVLFVNSTDAMNSLGYAITHNLAPVLSTSYGMCEQRFSLAEINTVQAWANEASAQGITIVGASGDGGAADCYMGPPPANDGLAVDFPGSSPNVTGLGGTEFNEGSNPSQYWNPTNNPSNGSAISYVPEEGWNDTKDHIAGGGGGASSLFAKPSWQTGTGVPNDGKRDVPDLALSASPMHVPYLICSKGNCVNGFRDAQNNLQAIGGTSLDAPAFAGIIALLNQRYGRQGNMNPRLYEIAHSVPSAFHDIVTGNNIVPCTVGSPDCPNGSMGYSAGSGYDQVTGLGSIDAFNLVTNWQTNSGSPDFQISVSPPALTIHQGSSSTASVSISALNSFSGTVNLSCSVPSQFSSSDCSISPTSIAGSGMATVTIGTLQAAAPVQRREFRAQPNPGASVLEQAFLAITVSLLTWFALILISGSRRPYQRMTILMCASFLVIACTGCGGGTKNQSAPVGTYNFQITGESGSVTRSSTIQITVQ